MSLGVAIITAWVEPLIEIATATSSGTLRMPVWKAPFRKAMVGMPVAVTAFVDSRSVVIGGRPSKPVYFALPWRRTPAPLRAPLCLPASPPQGGRSKGGNRLRLSQTPGATLAVAA